MSTRANIERFVDWGDHTVVVDPITRDHWIYDGYSKHAQSQNRGMAEDAKSILKGEGWHEAHHGTPSMYLPTTREIDMAEKYTYRVCGNEAAAAHDLQPPYAQTSQSARQGGVGDGRLPVVDGLLYWGRLQNKSTGGIEHEMREAERFIGTRLFDTSGYSR